MEKEKILSKKVLIPKLRRWLEALERDESFTIQVKGKKIFVPASAKVSVEFESSREGKELEFQVKWDDQASSQKRKK